MPSILGCFHHGYGGASQCLLTVDTQHYILCVRTDDSVLEKYFQVYGYARKSGLCDGSFFNVVGKEFSLGGGGGGMVYNIAQGIWEMTLTLL
jgi:hypothetical protein